MKPTENGRQRTEDYQKYLNTIRSFHLKEGPKIDWLEIRERKAPYEPSMMGPCESEVRNQNAQASAEALAHARRKDCIEYRSYEQLRYLHDQLFEGKFEAYLDLIALLGPYDALLSWGMSLTCGTDSQGCFEIRCNMNEDNLLPVVEQNFTSTGKLSKTKLTKTARMEIWKEMTGSVLVYLARHTFELFPLGEISILFVTVDTDDREKIYLRSKVNREEIMKKNFKEIDLLTILDGLQNCEMKFNQRSGFRILEDSE